MNTLDALLTGIVADPLEETRWLVLADWLEENDASHDAELLRFCTGGCWRRAANRMSTRNAPRGSAGPWNSWARACRRASRNTRRSCQAECRWSVHLSRLVRS